MTTDKSINAISDEPCAFMTSRIGDLPINSDGMRTAVDKISELMDRAKRLEQINDAYYKELMGFYAMLERWGLKGLTMQELDKWHDRMLWHVQKCNEYDFIPRSGIPLSRVKEFVEE